ncbi:MAG: type II CAAX endopeptidase family protein [Saprospiraceae bacterium]|nr:type II CAAX endopeptidase family protein [Saprospiraceae bacterium]
MEDHELQKNGDEPSTWLKLLSFLLIFGLCFFMGNVALVVMALAGGLPLEGGLDIFSAVNEPGMKPFIKAGIGLNHFIIFSCSAILYALWIKRKDWIQYFDFKSLNGNLLFNFVLLLVFAYPLIAISARLFENVEWANQFDQSSIEALMSVLQMDGIFDLLVNLLIVAVLPAIGEELLFRGVIQNEIVKRTSNYHVGIIIASIIFSGVHLQIQGFLPKMIIGLVLGYSYYWTKSLWYPIILHFLNNGMSTVAIFFLGDNIESMENEANQPEIWQFLIVVVFSCFLCSFIIKNIRSQLSDKTIESV